MDIDARPSKGTKPSLLRSAVYGAIAAFALIFAAGMADAEAVTVDLSAGISNSSGSVGRSAIRAAIANPGLAFAGPEETEHRLR